MKHHPYDGHEHRPTTYTVVPVPNVFVVAVSSHMTQQEAIRAAKTRAEHDRGRVRWRNSDGSQGSVSYGATT